ncbi:hypothetical protein R1sor_007024 [Riccia sorocarpa]|uniref:Uncharacterized protein n=1 Tax=Riccia sorocarpa TaxID=122646 RepID=A0ABD3HPS5_9MARC
MLKGKRALALRIHRYWETRYKEEFDTWDELATSYTIPDRDSIRWLEGMLKFDKGDKGDKEVAGSDVSSSDVEEDDSSKKKKNPRKKTSVDVLPSHVKTGLHRFHCAKHGDIAPQRLEPLEILRIKDISQYQLTLDEKLSCKLVFLDLTHPDILAWERQKFNCFLDIVRELTVATEFAIVAIMDF